MSAIGSVCELPAVTKFFNGNPVLGTLGGGIDAFAGRSRPQALGRDRGRRSAAAGTASSTPSTRSSPPPTSTRPHRRRPRPNWPSPHPNREVVEEPTTTSRRVGRRDRRRRRHRRRSPRRSPQRPRTRCSAATRTSGSGRHRPGPDHDQRRHLLHAALLPRRRAEVPGPQRPNQRVRLRAVAGPLPGRRARDDLSGFGTYDDIRTAATDGSLRIKVIDENVYVLSGIADDLADGPDAVDRDQLELAVELLRDVGEYAEDATVDEALDADQPLGRCVATCSTPTRSASPRRRTPRPSSSGRRWRPSSNRGCARSSAMSSRRRMTSVRSDRGHDHH